jgi:hypothetical protein
MPDRRTWFLTSRSQEIESGKVMPQELIFEVRCPGTDLDDARMRAETLSASATPLISFAVNAFVDVPQAYVAYEASEGRSSRRFWQANIDRGAVGLAPAALLRAELLHALLDRARRSAESRRLGRAISHYHAALRNWTRAALPQALFHLYPALEALAPAAERAERRRLGLGDVRAHAIYREVDVTQENWKEVLLGWVRRDVICKGDKATYDTARKASNGLEHGSLDLPLIRTDAERVTPKLFEYVRGGILDLLDLDVDMRDRLAGMSPIDITPFRHGVAGVLTGNVADPTRLGADGEAYPRLDAHATIDDHTDLLGGGRTVTRHTTHVLQAAPGTLFTLLDQRMDIGLNSPAEFEFKMTGAATPDDGLIA